MLEEQCGKMKYNFSVKVYRRMNDDIRFDRPL